MKGLLALILAFAALPALAGQNVAWFLESQGEVRWCVKVPRGLQGAQERIRVALERSFSNWAMSLEQVGLADSLVDGPGYRDPVKIGDHPMDADFIPWLQPGEPRVATRYLFVDGCTGNESLTVYLGDGYAEIPAQDKAERYSLSLESYDESSGKGRGWIWINREKIASDEDLAWVFDRAFACIVGWNGPEFRPSNHGLTLDVLNQILPHRPYDPVNPYFNRIWELSGDNGPSLVEVLTGRKDLQIDRIQAGITHSGDHDSSWDDLKHAAEANGTIRSAKSANRLYIKLTGPETRHKNINAQDVDGTYLRFTPDGPARISAGENTGLFVRKYQGKTYWAGPRGYEASGHLEAFKNFHYNHTIQAFGFRQRGHERVRVSKLVIAEDGSLTFTLPMGEVSFSLSPKERRDESF